MSGFLETESNGIETMNALLFHFDEHVRMGNAVKPITNSIFFLLF